MGTASAEHPDVVVVGGDSTSARATIDRLRGPGSSIPILQFHSVDATGRELGRLLSDARAALDRAGV